MSAPAPPPRVPWHALPDDACSRGRVIKFTNARVYHEGRFVREDLWVRDGRVIDPASRFWEAADFREYSCDLVVDCEDNVLSPGFIDLQFNGAGGLAARAAAARGAVALIFSFACLSHPSRRLRRRLF